MKPAQMLVSGWIDKNSGCIHSGILFRYSQNEVLLSFAAATMELQIIMLSKTSWTHKTVCTAHSHASVNDEINITERWYSTAGNRGWGERWYHTALWGDSRYKQSNTAPSFQEGVKSPTHRINAWWHRTACCLWLDYTLYSTLFCV